MTRSGGFSITRRIFPLPRIFKTFITFQEVLYLPVCQDFKHHLYNIIMTETPVELNCHAVRNGVKKNNITIITNEGNHQITTRLYT